MSENAHFVPRAPWWGADLQTLRNQVAPPRVPPWPEPVRLSLPARDGSDDTLLALLHPGSRERPLLVLIHGLAGSEDSGYMLRSTAHFTAAGYRVLRLNLRGAGPSRPLCRGHYHAGRSDDLAAALHGLPEAEQEAGLVAIGFSLGGNLLLKFLGEGAHGLPLRAAASVSAPIDLARACRRIQDRRNWVYHRYLLRKLRQQTLAAPELDAERRAAVHRVRTIYDFDEQIVAPLGGFAGARDYYARCSARSFLRDIETPTLLVHARNDPWIPVESYDEVAWAEHPALAALLPRGGGHVGFHAADHTTPWHDRRIEDFFAHH